MRTGEEFLTWGWEQYAILAVILAIYLCLALRNKLPSMGAFKDFLDAVNSVGGHIFLLTLLTVWSIKIAMQFFYHLLSLPQEQIDKGSAIITAGLTFVQGTLVGMFVSALLKTMTGGKANGTTPAVPDTLVASVVPANGKEK